MRVDFQPQRQRGAGRQRIQHLMKVERVSPEGFVAESVEAEDFSSVFHHLERILQDGGVESGTALRIIRERSSIALRPHGIIKHGACAKDKDSNRAGEFTFHCVTSTMGEFSQTYDQTGADPAIARKS